MKIITITSKLTRRFIYLVVKLKASTNQCYNIQPQPQKGHKFKGLCTSHVQNYNPKLIVNPGPCRTTNLVSCILSGPHDTSICIASICKVVSIWVSWTSSMKRYTNYITEKKDKTSTMINRNESR